MLLLQLILVALLIVATAFFVAAEFAFVRLRSSRVEQMVAEGLRNARAVQTVTRNLDSYLSACQLGITITALGLGWLGEPTVEQILHPAFEYYGVAARVGSLLSFAIAFAVITFLHVVLGELAPKTVSIQKAELVSILTARPIMIFYKIMYPFIWSLNGSANWLVRLFGIRPANEHEEAHSEEELRLILTDSYRSGKINQSEYGYVNKIFAFDQLLAREIMVPRIDMVCIDVNEEQKEYIQAMKSEQYTRFPIIDGDKDQILGLVNTKQFFMQFSHNPGFSLLQLIQPILSVSEAIPVKDLLLKMQKKQIHMAILVDEFGGTSGLLTIEDILEEIVGEIRDEFDSDEHPDIEMVGKHHVIVDGKVSLEVVQDLFNIQLEHDEVETIGGWLFSRNALLKKGAKWQYGPLQFVVKERERYRIRRIEILKLTAP